MIAEITGDVEIAAKIIAIAFLFGVIMNRWLSLR